MTNSLRLLAAAIAALAVVGVGAIWYIGQSTHPSPPASTQSPISSPRSAATALPSPSQLPTRSTEVGRGWVTTSSNRPGLYSWDGNRCAGTHCSVNGSGGFMHNCYGPCDVAITIGLAPDAPIAAGATEVTIAGRSGWYRHVAEPEPSFAISKMNGYEEWIVDLDGVVFAIRLYAKPDVSEAGLGDAHAIIHSLHAVPSTRNSYGFALVFTLTTGDWDSG